MEIGQCSGTFTIARQYITHISYTPTYVTPTPGQYRLLRPVLSHLSVDVTFLVQHGTIKQLSKLPTVRVEASKNNYFERMRLFYAK